MLLIDYLKGGARFEVDGAGEVTDRRHELLSTFLRHIEENAVFLPPRCTWSEYSLLSPSRYVIPSPSSDHPPGRPGHPQVRRLTATRFHELADDCFPEGDER